MIARDCWQCLAVTKWMPIPQIMERVCIYQCQQCGWIRVEPRSEQPDRREGTKPEVDV